MILITVFLLLVCGLIFIQRRSYLDILFAIVLISNGINLAIFLRLGTGSRQLRFHH